MKTKKAKRSLVLLLVLAMVLSLLGSNAWAVEATSDHAVRSADSEQAEMAAPSTMAATSGKCGKKLTWSFKGTTLTISGTGAMNSYEEDDIPWAVLNVKELVVEDGVTTIGEWAFFECTSLKRVTLASSVKKIDWYAFGNCENLTTVTIPEGLTTIESNAFLYCSSLRSIDLPNSVTYIGGSAFSDSGLTSIVLPDRVTNIDELTFISCFELESIVIPRSVKSVKYAAFEESGLQRVYYKGTESEWNKVTIGSGNKVLTDAVIYYEYGKADAAHKALSDCVITLDKNAFLYDGKAKTPTVTVLKDEEELTNGKDYVIEYINNVNVGTGKVTITGKGDYVGTATVAFTIRKQANTITVSNITKVTSAKAQAVKLNAKAKGGAKLSYKSNNKSVKVDKNGKVIIAKKFVGRATITVTAAATKQFNAATKTVTVTVNPASTKLSSVKNSVSKSMKVTWKKNATVTGYLVQYSTASNFKGAKAVNVKKAKTTSTTVKKLSKGKKYYVRVRTYQKVSGKTYYSAWSASKNVTIKK